MTAVISDKVTYVLKTPNSKPGHICHWPGCKKKVKAALWGCYSHWMKLPANLRAEIWRTYQIGQETPEGRPSPAYLKSASKAQDWIKNHLREM